MLSEKHIAAIFAITAVACLPADSQIIGISEANWIKREFCTIVTPEYTGSCKFTVTTDGGGKGLNIHFSLNEVGDQGVTWVVSGIIKKTMDTAFLSTDLVLTRFPAIREYASTGTCSVRPTAFKCLTSDGRIQSYATGVVQ